MLRALKKKEEERVGKAIFNSFCKLAYVLEDVGV